MHRRCMVGITLQKGIFILIGISTMENSIIESGGQGLRASLEAQRSALVAQLEMHVSRSEDLAAKVAAITQELADLEKGGET